MASNNLSVKLHARQDGDGETFYVGKLDFPGFIDCRDGVTFLIFTSDKGDEQLQIAVQDNKKKKND